MQYKLTHLKYSFLPFITLYQGSPPITFTNDPAVSLTVEGPITGNTNSNQDLFQLTKCLTIIFFFIFWKPIFSATSNIPKTPIVVFTTNLPVLTPAFFNSPCKTLFGMVTNLDKLSRALLTPDLIGEGKSRYPLATGLNIILSKTLFTANVALINCSKQSLLGFDFFEI